MKRWFWKTGKRDLEIDNLRLELELVKHALEEARVCLFLQIVEYKHGMSLNDNRPKPIRLEDLDQRITRLETLHKINCKGEVINGHV